MWDIAGDAFDSFEAVGELEIAISLLMNRNWRPKSLQMMVMLMRMTMAMK